MKNNILVIVLILCTVNVMSQSGQPFPLDQLDDKDAQQYYNATTGLFELGDISLGMDKPVTEITVSGQTGITKLKYEDGLIIPAWYSEKTNGQKLILKATSNSLIGLSKLNLEGCSGCTQFATSNVIKVLGYKNGAVVATEVIDLPKSKDYTSIGKSFPGSFKDFDEIHFQLENGKLSDIIISSFRFILTKPSTVKPTGTAALLTCSNSKTNARIDVVTPFNGGSTAQIKVSWDEGATLNKDNLIISNGSVTAPSETRIGGIGRPHGTLKIYTITRRNTSQPVTIAWKAKGYCGNGSITIN